MLRNTATRSTEMSHHLLDSLQYVDRWSECWRKSTQTYITECAVLPLLMAPAMFSRCCRAECWALCGSACCQHKESQDEAGMYPCQRALVKFPWRGTAVDAWILRLQHPVAVPENSVKSTLIYTVCTVNILHSISVFFVTFFIKYLTSVLLQLLCYSNCLMELSFHIYSTRHESF